MTYVKYNRDKCYIIKEIIFPFFLKKDFIYLFMTDTYTEREAEAQEEGEAGSMQGA